MKSALISGACGGIGQALFNVLEGKGWQVYGTDIADRPPHSRFKEFWQGDIADDHFWRNEVVPGLQKAGSLSAFVHSAAIQPCIPIADMTVQQWTETLGVNLTAAFLGTRYLIPFLKISKGAIVNVASVHAIATSPGMAAYVSSKGGLVAFTRAASLELAKWNIRVNAVLPGAVDTQMLSDGLARSSEGRQAAKELLIERTPLGRISDPSEVAKAIAFLLDEEQASFITGQSLVVDGGTLARLATE